MRRFAVAVVLLATACNGSPADGAAQTSLPAPSVAPGVGFAAMSGGECNLLTDADVHAATGITSDRVVTSNVGCSWEGDYDLGVWAWWYRGAELDVERVLERDSGRDIRELDLSGQPAFMASDDAACSIYVASGTDILTFSVIADSDWRPGALCQVVRELTDLSLSRVN